MALSAIASDFFIRNNKISQFPVIGKNTRRIGSIVDKNKK